MKKTKHTVLLRPKCQNDAAQDYIWQSDPELCYLNATKPILLPFDEYSILYRRNLCSSRLGIQWAIMANGRHIGNCASYNYDYKAGSAEIGILIGEASNRRLGYGSKAIKELLAHVFADPNINTLRLKTLKENNIAICFFQKVGFTEYGQSLLKNRLFILMELKRQNAISVI